MQPQFEKIWLEHPIFPFYSDCFGEAVALAKERMDQKNVYFTNPAFDK